MTNWQPFHAAFWQRFARYLDPRRSLAARVNLTFTCFFLVLAVIYHFSVNLQAAATFEQLSTAEIQANAIQASDTIGRFITDHTQTLQLTIALAEGNLGPLALSLPLLTSQQPVFQELLLVDQQGQLVGRAGEIVPDDLLAQPAAPWFVTAQQGQPYLSPLQMAAASQPYVVLALPVQAGRTQRGVLAARLDMQVLWATVTSIQVSGTGQVYVVDENGQVVAHRDLALVLQKYNVTTRSVGAFLTTHPTTVQQFLGLAGEPVYGWAQSIPGTPWWVVTEVPQATVQAPVHTLQMILGGTILLAILLTQWVGSWLAAQVTHPVRDLTQTAVQLAAGNLQIRVHHLRRDEIGQLARAFNLMAEQLQRSLTMLETRAQVQTALATLSQRLAGNLTPEQLLQQVVQDVQQTFQYYHVHLFLLEETSQMLISAASADDAPAPRIAEQLRFPITAGLAGQAVRTQAPVVVSDIHATADYLAHPALNETRSAMAVPVMVSGKVLGVLSVEERRETGLTHTDAEWLQGIANQVGFALQNARVLVQTQQRADREAQLNRLAQALQKATTVEGVLGVAARELGQTLSVPQVVVRLGTTPVSSLLERLT